MVEPLESRRYCDITLARHVMHVTGTQAADQIVVERSGAAIRVTVDGEVQRFRASAVRLLKIDAGSSNDVVNVQATLTIPASITGGRGNDRIYGGAGNDTLFGGVGDDTLYGRDGINYMDGGTGDDTFNEYSPLNVVYGGAGNDRVNQLGPYPKANFFTDIEYSGMTYATYIGLLRRQGRLLLHLDVHDPGDGAYAFSGPVARPDGNYYVRERFTIHGPAVDPYSSRKVLDVSAALGHTLYFITNDTDPTIEYPSAAPARAVTFPLLLPETTV